MNDHNLDDLIIGEPESHGGKSRNLLTLLALLMIILIVGAILAKLILGGGDEILEEKSDNPELTSVVTHPSGRHPSAPRESIPEELKPIVDENVPSPPHRLKHSAPQTAKNTRKKEKSSLEPVHPVRAKTSKSKPATHTQRPTPKPSELFHATQKARSQSSTKKPSASGKTYTIQVGAFKRPPTQKFLDEIKAKGYTPLIVKNGGVIKVRIGSWGSYAEAKAHLPEIKEKLGISGFVVRRK